MNSPTLSEIKETLDQLSKIQEELECFELDVSDYTFTLTEGSPEHDNACYLGSALNDAGARIEDAITDVREALKHVKFED